MPDAVQLSQGAAKPFVIPGKPFAPEDEAALREALKRCSPSTFEAAVQFRKTGNPEHLPAVVIGVIERFVEPDLRIKLKDADDDLRLIEERDGGHRLRVGPCLLRLSDCRRQAEDEPSEERGSKDVHACGC